MRDSWYGNDSEPSFWNILPILLRLPVLFRCFIAQYPANFLAIDGGNTARKENPCAVGPLDVALCIVLFAGLVFPFFLRHAFAQEGYRLADSAAVQRLPDRQGGLSGMKTSAPRTVVLPDGTSIVVYVVEKIDVRTRPPFKNGDVLYAVNGVLFTSLDGMPRYVQSLAPGSTATVEFLQAPRKRWNGRAVPLEQMPSVSATVEIFSTPSRYACPTCPKPPPPTPEQK